MTPVAFSMPRRPTPWRVRQSTEGEVGQDKTRGGGIGLALLLLSRARLAVGESVGSRQALLRQWLPSNRASVRRTPARGRSGGCWRAAGTRFGILSRAYFAASG